MSMGGGTFTVQNKILPGSYINFVSTASAATLGERGKAALPLGSWTGGRRARSMPWRPGSSTRRP